MDDYLIPLSLSFIPCFMLGWLACEVYIRNPSHSLNRIASIMFALMMMEFGVSYLESSFPSDHAPALVMVLDIMPSIVLTFMLMLFFRQLTVRSDSKRANAIDVAMGLPPAAGLLLLVYPETFNVRAQEAAENEVLGIPPLLLLILLLTTACWTYCAIKWCGAWFSLRKENSEDPKRVQFNQAGWALLGGAGLTFVSILTEKGPLYDTAYPSLRLYGMLLFSFFIRRAILHFGLMPSIMEKYRVLFDLSPFGVVLLDRQGIIREANPAVLLLFGLTANQIKDKPLASFIESGELIQANQGYALTELDIVNTRMGHRRVIVHANELIAEGERLTYVLLQDVTERRKAEEENAYLAYHDPLTGLGNRLQFREALDELLGCEGRGALLLLDLDRFKTVNDRFGHQAGDALLRSIAGKLQDHVPASGWICRIGGDEFAVLLPDSGNEEWQPEQVGAQLLSSLIGEDGDVYPNTPVTVSIGIACWPEHATDSENLFHAADLALYQAKQSGRNRCLTWKEERSPVGPFR